MLAYDPNGGDGEDPRSWIVIAALGVAAGLVLLALGAAPWQH